MPDHSFPETLNGWHVIKSVPNPWGQVRMTDGGKVLPEQNAAYMERIRSMATAADPVSKRHHYVPQTYLRHWSDDGKRLWALDTASGNVRRLGIKDLCVKENFHRVRDSEGVDHNRVELLFGVVDQELRRVQALFNQLEDPDELEFSDLISLGATLAVQRTRTLQQRRLLLQYNRWLHAQNPTDSPLLDDDPDNPHSLAGFHTEAIFRSMWEAADVMTTKQIEIWDDPEGRFLTCDAPVITPFRRNVRPGLLESGFVIWPISPHRVVAMSQDPAGVKAVFRRASGKMVGIVRQGIEQGRERMIFATEEQRDRLPDRKRFRRRTQMRLRCSQRGPDGHYVAPPGCVVVHQEGYAERPDVVLCDNGLHRPAPEMNALS